MNFDLLRQLVAGGETEEVEFKESISGREAAARTVCGMLNSQRGGTVLFGVTDSGELRGLHVGQQTHDRLRGEIRKIDPPVSLGLETVPLDDELSVIVIRIPGNTGVYRYDGRPYARFGASTSIMAETTYQAMLMERMHSLTRWENQPAQSVDVTDLDSSEIVTTIEEAIRNGRMADPETRDPTRLLQGLNLWIDGQLLNAAVVLFGKPAQLEPWYPQCRLRLARFRGQTKSEFIDNRQVVGNSFEPLRRAQRFLLDHMPIAGRVIPERFERIDEPLYPIEALREALANAFCHRDYAEAGGGVDLAMYDDRLEVTSTGGLRFGLTVQDLLKEHQSRSWNPLIAQTFYLRGIIESWGRGTLKMIELAERAGLETPAFESGHLFFTVTFRAQEYVPPTRIAHDLTDIQRELLSVLRQIGPAPIGGIQEHVAPVLSDVRFNAISRRCGVSDLLTWWVSVAVLGGACCSPCAN